MDAAFQADTPNGVTLALLYVARQALRIILRPGGDWASTSRATIAAPKRKDVRATGAADRDTLPRRN